jgi:hypothetical protein
MNTSEVNWYKERLAGLVKDLQFDLKYEKDVETIRYLQNMIRHLNTSVEVFNRVEGSPNQ